MLVQFGNNWITKFLGCQIGRSKLSSGSPQNFSRIITSVENDKAEKSVHSAST